MKKSLQLLCLGFVCLVIGTGLQLMYTFPVDTQPYVEKKYAGWNGVLQAWVCSSWEPGGSFIRWLNSRAAEYEKDHEGVYLEFTPVSVESLNALGDDSIPQPDLLFFSPGTLSTPSQLTVIQSNGAIRIDLRDYGRGYTLPVAMSGYIWAYNPSLCESAPTNPDELTMLTLPSGQQAYSAALLGLLSAASENNATPLPLPDNGIDLGLPVSNTEAAFYSESAMDMFINSTLPCIPVSSNDLNRLLRLRSSGKGPDWKLYASGSIACTDLLLMGGIPVRHSGSERAQLAESFLLFLLDDESQSALADIGAQGVTGEIIHSGFSVYRELDALLNSRPLWLPDCFSEYSAENSEAIVRRFLNKEISAKEALSMLGFEGM